MLVVVMVVTVTATAGTFKTIDVTDTSFSDWAGVPILANDPADNVGGVDFADVYLANDADFLYVRFTLHEPADPLTFESNYFFDTDADALTGFHVFGSPNFGSEMLIQSGAGFDERGGGFNEGGVAGLDFLSSGNGASTDFQFRVSRSATYVSDAAAVFNGDDIEVILETDNEADDIVQNGVFGVPYTFAVPEPAGLTLLALGGLSLLRRRR